MTILDRLMTEVDTRGSVSSTELAHRLGVTVSALDGMLGALTARGHLVVDSLRSGEGTPSCSGASCAACPGFEECPFVAAVPQPRRLVTQDTLGTTRSTLTGDERRTP